MENPEINGPEQKPAYTHFLLPGAILIAAFLISGTLLYSKKTNQEAQIGNQAGQQQGADPSKVVDIKITDADHILGNKDAKVTIVEFSDMQCPFCRSFFQDSYSQILKNYVNTGKARVVFRHYPLDFHPSSKLAAEALECAGEQGKFFEMHDKLFQEQGKQGQGTVAFTIQDVKKWSGAIKLTNKAQFDKCVDSNKYQQRIDADLAYGSSIGVSGTPSFFVNGKVLVGAQPFSAFKTAIDQALGL